MRSTSQLRQLVQDLKVVRTTFGKRAAARKASLLSRCAPLPLSSPRFLQHYHDVLLFLAAYPDNADVRLLVDSELKRVAEAAAELTRKRPEALADTGIAGTTVESAFSVDTMAWLCDRFPNDVEVAWSDESAGVGLDSMLWAFVTSAERDGLFTTTMSTREWVQRARGADGSSDLAWLVRQFQQLHCSANLLDDLVEKADLRIRWKLAQPSASITFARFSSRPAFYQRRAPSRTFRPSVIINQRLPAAKPLTIRQATQLIDTARAALTARLRETDPITYANPREVTLFQLDRGIDIALFGMMPSRRLPVESFIGYVLARNRLPAAYGGGWMLFDRAEIGINVFESFRGGESARFFAEIMRVYRQHFGVRQFRIDPYQFGAGNTEAIRSGAFWFYYRFGFRPTDPALAQMAREEWGRIQQDRSYRTPAAMLRQFATSQLVGHDGLYDGGPDLLALGLAVTKMIGEKFNGDRTQAERWSRRRVSRMLFGPNARSAADWPEPQRDAFNRLSVMIAMFPDLADWSTAEKRSLAAWMRAKGGIRERDFILKGQRHRRLRVALTQLASTPALH